MAVLTVSYLKDSRGAGVIGYPMMRGFTSGVRALSSIHVYP